MSKVTFICQVTEGVVGSQRRSSSHFKSVASAASVAESKRGSLRGGSNGGTPSRWHATARSSTSRRGIEEEQVSIFSAGGRYVYACEKGVSKLAVQEELQSDADFSRFKEAHGSVLAFEFDAVGTTSVEPSIYDN